MSQNKEYMYIVYMNNMIFELEYTPQRFALATKAMETKGLFGISGKRNALNGSQMLYVLDDEEYMNHVDVTQPKVFVRHGCWYSISNRNEPIRYSDWKRKEIDEKIAKKNALPAPKGKLADKKYFAKIKKQLIDSKTIIA